MDPNPGSDRTEALRRLPAVDALLQAPVVAPLLEEFPRGELLSSIRTVLDERRSALRAGRHAATDLPTLALAVRGELQRRRQPSLRRVINATGVVLHTGLGRAPLAPEAIEAITAVAAGYSNLELDLATGERGDRHCHTRDLLCELSGAEDALVVNNNAAATLLALNSLAAGRGGAVSRGQLVEIGGSYRMPDVMAAAGVRLVEVGTTNRTHLRDYEQAIQRDADLALLLRVHTSNYRVVGFTAAVPIAALTELRERQRPARELYVVDDLGSGLLSREMLAGADSRGGAEGSPFADEPTVCDSLDAGADVVLFSGDKLLGGPQAGVIVGRRHLLDRMRANPLMRTFRPDKMTLAALEATLRLHRDPQSAARHIPVLGLLTASTDALRGRAEHLARLVSRPATPRATAGRTSRWRARPTTPTPGVERCRTGRWRPGPSVCVRRAGT